MRSPSPFAGLALLSSIPVILAQSSSGGSFVPGVRTSAAASSTTTGNAVQTSATIASTPTASPSLIFVPISPVTACGSARINWQLYNEDPALYDITLSVMNLGVDQSIPVSTTAPASTSTAPSSAVTSRATSSTTPLTSAAASTTSASAFRVPDRRALEARTNLQINATVIVQNANIGFSWSPIGLPEGRYFLVGNVDDPYGTSGVSTIFTVLNGTDMSCLANSNLTAGAIASTSASSTSTSSSVSTSASSSATVAAASSGGHSGIGTGGIVGAVVGVIAGLAILGLIAFCCIRRKRQSRPTQDMEEKHEPFAWRNSQLPSEPAESHDDHSAAPTLSIPVAATAPRLFDVHSIKSSRPDSVGDMLWPRRASEESFSAILSMVRTHPTTPSAVSDPFMTPQSTPSDEPHAAPLATSAAAPGTPEDPNAARPESPFSPDPTSTNHTPRTPKELRRASSPVTHLPPVGFNSSAAPARGPQAMGIGMPRSRSIGEIGDGAHAAAAASGQRSGSGGALMTRTTSKRRKPVPVLGPELTGEIERHHSQKGGRSREGSGSSSNEGRKGQGKDRYSLVPDMPLEQK